MEPEIEEVNLVITPSGQEFWYRDGKKVSWQYIPGDIREMMRG